MTTEMNYQRAERFSQLPVIGEVRNASVLAHWVPGSNCFWYERQVSEGTVIRLVDPRNGQNEPAFDHDALCLAMKDIMGEEASSLTPETLPLDQLRIALDPTILTFTAFGARWRYDAQNNICERLDEPVHAAVGTYSPDGRYRAFIKDYNLWLEDTKTGKERQLTSDGIQHCAYGAESAMKCRYPNMPTPPKAPHMAWSSDGKRIFTFRMDERQVLPVHTIEYVPIDGSQRPRHFETRWAGPGEEHVPMALFVAIDIETGEVVNADYPPVPLVRMNDSFFEVGLAWFGADCRHAYFVHAERGEKDAHVVEFDTDTGKSKTVFSEHDDLCLELGPSVYARTNVYYLSVTNELIWQSERTGNAHLYRYDLNTGELKNPITQGPWRVREVLHIDEAREEVWFSASGIEADAYVRSLYRIGLDGEGLKRLTYGEDDHFVVNPGDFGVSFLETLGTYTGDVSGVSPCGDFFIDTFGTVEAPTQTVVCDRDGNVLFPLETADYSAVEDIWQWPEQFTVLADDGETNIHGVMIKPPGFTENKKYPVIDLIYGGPQINYAPQAMMRTFQEQLSQTDGLSLSALGAVVVILDGRGSAARTRAFQKHHYGQVHRASDIDDHVTAIRQLAEKHEYLDLDRVGITGISAGGYATAHAMLCRPDFFKVGVASSGNYDQRFFTHGWGERYHGLVDGDNYISQTLLPHVENLKGRLLFTHGILDHGCNMGPLMQLSQALMFANKDFDMILDPMRGHDRSSYVTRRMWDYFVEHLFGETPPKEVSILHGMDLLIQRMSH